MERGSVIDAQIEFIDCKPVGKYTGTTEWKQRVDWPDAEWEQYCQEMAEQENREEEEHAHAKSTGCGI